MKEPPIMHSEFHPDGGPLNKEALHHSDENPEYNPEGERLNMEDLHHSSSERLENHPEGEPLNKEGLYHSGGGPVVVPSGGEPQHNAFNLQDDLAHSLQNDFKSPSVTASLSANEQPPSINNPFNELINHHADHMQYNQPISFHNAANQPMKSHSSKSHDHAHAHHVHGGQSDVFKIAEMASHPEEVHVTGTQTSPTDTSLPSPEDIHIMHDDKPSSDADSDISNSQSLKTSENKNNNLLSNASGFASTELSKSDEKNAVVELDMPSKNTDSTSIASGTERINDNILENIKEQKWASEDSEDGVSETMHPSEKVATLDVKLNDDDTSIANMDTNVDNVASKTPVESFSSSSPAQKTNEEDISSTDFNTDSIEAAVTEMELGNSHKTSLYHNGNHHKHKQNGGHHVPTSLEKEIEEVTKLIDSNNPSSVKDAKLARVEEKLIQDSNLKNVDINSLLNDEDQQLDEEIRKLQDQGNMEFRKAEHHAETNAQLLLDDRKDVENYDAKNYDTKSNGEKKSKQQAAKTVSSYIGTKREKGEENTGLKTSSSDGKSTGNTEQTLSSITSKHSINKTPTKKSSESHSPEKSLNSPSSPPMKGYGLNSEEEAMISDILAKSHSSVPSEFDDALHSTTNSVAESGGSREKISQKRKITTKKAPSTIKEKNKCRKNKNNDSKNNYNENCLPYAVTKSKAANEKLVPDPTEKHRHSSNKGNQTLIESPSDNESDAETESESESESESTNNNKNHFQKNSNDHDEQIKSLKQTLKDAPTTKSVKQNNKSFSKQVNSNRVNLQKGFENSIINNEKLPLLKETPISTNSKLKPKKHSTLKTPTSASRTPSITRKQQQFTALNTTLSNLAIPQKQQQQRLTSHILPTKQSAFSQPMNRSTDDVSRK